MRNYILVILIFVCSFSFAQNKLEDGVNKRKELHLRVQDFSPFSIGLNYKQQVKPKGFVTVSLINIGASHSNVKYSSSDFYPTSTTKINGGVAIGYEFRKEFKEKFTLYHGPNIGYVHNYEKSFMNNPNLENKSTTSNTYSAIFPYNIGLMYKFHKNILISAQLSPQLRYSYNKTNNRGYISTENSYNFSFSNLAGTLALVFRFNE